MLWAFRGVGLALVAVVLATAAVVVVASTRTPEAVTHATITMRYSKFDVRELTVPAGQPVTFVLVNNDPIAHEWIVGDEATHEGHRTGTEPYHDTIPTEVTVKAYETKTTIVTFDTPGEYVYVCHLPGHEEYGMKGVIRVVSD